MSASDVYDSITHKHELLTNEEMEQEVEFIGRVKMSINTDLEGDSSVLTMISDNSDITYIRRLCFIKDDNGNTVHNYVALLGHYGIDSNKVYISSKRGDEFSYQILTREGPYYIAKPKVRKGKLSKILNYLDASQADIKRVMTEYNIKEKVYEIYQSRNFFSHYRRMHIDNTCTSCMSKDVDSYNVVLNTEAGYNLMYSPLIAYENDDRWALLLLKDTSRINKYPYVARAVLDKGAGTYVDAYGLSTLFERVMKQLREDKVTEYTNGSPESPILKLLTTSGRIVAPWVDDSCGFDNDGSELTLHGEIENKTEGVIGFVCIHCEGVGEVPERTEDDGDSWCDDCYQEVFCFDNEGSIRYKDDCIEIDGEYYYSEGDSVVKTDDTGEYILIDEAIYVEGGYYYENYYGLVCIDGDYYLKDDDSICCTEDTNEYILIEDAIEVDGKFYEEEPEEGLAYIE